MNTKTIKADIDRAKHKRYLIHAIKHYNSLKEFIEISLENQFKKDHEKK